MCCELLLSTFFLHASANMNTVLFMTLLTAVTLMNSNKVQSQVLKIEDLEHYYDLEEKLVANVQDYLKQQKENLQLLKQRYEGHKWTQGQLSNKEKEQYLSNPLNIHALIRRLTAEWPLTLALLNDARNGMFAEEEEDLVEQPRVLPTPQEYTEAVISLTRLQRVHNLTTAELVSGRSSALMATDRSSHLTGTDCYSIGQNLYENHYYSSAVEWFKEALKLFEKEGKKKGEPVERTLEYLSLASCYIGDRKKTNYYFQKLYTTYPSFYPSLELIKDHLTVMEGSCLTLAENYLGQQSMDINVGNLTLQEKANLTRDYERLCRSGASGYRSQSLRCHTADLGRPHLRLAPLRLEPLNLDPPVLQLHGFVSPAILDGTLGDDIKEGLVSETKRQLTTNEEGQALRRLVELTPLLLHRDNMAVYSSYAAGTEQILHQDAMIQEEGVSAYDRMITMLTYVEAPQSGGELVFPHVSLSLAPQRGSVLLWYNLNPYGYPDPWSTYGACPILHGQKTTITTWLMDHEMPTCSARSVHDYKATLLYKLMQHVM